MPTIKERKEAILLEIAKKKEILDALEAKESFYKFCVYMDSVFFTGKKPHLKIIAESLQEIAEGIINELAISLPPRAGKSYIISLFCAWMLGKHPDGSVMRNSYAEKLAEKFSKDIRDGIITNEKYKKVFPGVEISKTNSAVDAWCINQYTQPAYFCAGVGGPITGFGCKTIAILDDPIKNIEEALSELTVENLWNWYTSTHLSRLETGCPEIHIATRWTKKDPIGRLTDPKSEFYKPNMKVINVPALDENGDSFCEEVKTTEEYQNIKKITADFIWEAEFMQEPVESKGLLFTDLKYFSMDELRGKESDGVIGYTDTADQGTDYLCAPIGKRYGEYTYITDVLFTQEGVEITKPLAAQLMIDTKCKIMNVEANAGGKSFADNVQEIITRKINELKTIGTPEAMQKASHLSGYFVYYKQTTQNKETRILMNSGYVKQYFYFRNDYEPGSDYDKFMRQFTSYLKMGKNKHDDAPDAVTGLAEYMQNEFYLQPNKGEELKGYYTEDELDDLVKEGKITRWEAKEHLKKYWRPWEKVV